MQCNRLDFHVEINNNNFEAFPSRRWLPTFIKSNWPAHRMSRPRFTLPRILWTIKTAMDNYGARRIQSVILCRYLIIAIYIDRSINANKHQMVPRWNCKYHPECHWAVKRSTSDDGSVGCDTIFNEYCLICSDSLAACLRTCTLYGVREAHAHTKVLGKLVR